MKIRLRGRKREGPVGTTAAGDAEAEASSPLKQRMSQRQFFKLLVTGAGLAGAATLAQGPLLPRHVTAETQQSGNWTLLDGADAPPLTLKVQSGATASGPRLRLASTATGGRSWEIGSAQSSDGAVQGELFLRDATANAHRLVIDSAGNVGIGTIAPQAQLHVNTSLQVGDTSPRQALEIYGGSADLLVGSASQDGDVYVRNMAGTSNVHLADDGSVAVGKTFPAGGTKLDVNGLIAANGSTPITALPPNIGGNVGWKIGLYGDQYAVGIAGWTVALLTNQWVGVFAPSLPPANNATGTAPDTSARVALGSDGKGYFAGSVGIGALPTSAKLHIVAPDLDGGVKLLSNSAASHASYGIGRTSTEGNLGVAAANGHYSDIATPGDIVIKNLTQDLILSAYNTVGAIRFATGQSPDTEKMVVANDGNVGIGVTSPAYKLDVRGSGKGIVNVESPASSDQAGIHFFRTGESDDAYVFFENFGATGVVSNSNRLVFEVKDDDEDYAVFRHSHWNQSYGSRDVLSIYRSRVVIDSNVELKIGTQKIADSAGAYYAS